MDFPTRLRAALDLARNELLAARSPAGHWAGELSSSALSTATAVCALALVGKHDSSRDSARASILISKGIDWLARNVNTDGGWGDTPISLSNVSTTTLCWTVFGVVPGAEDKYRDVVGHAEHWLRERTGGGTPARLAPAIIARYGKDRTFSVPILTMCALAGRLGSGADAWKYVVPLPFELAALPHQFFAALRLPVVSYALPALIAIGQARHHHLPSRNPLVRVVRNSVRNRTLKVLNRILPDSGGFLEATPLTSFVVMSLAASGQVHHPVTKQGVKFLVRSALDDGSWPIDANLSTWVTTLAVNALTERGEPLLDDDHTKIRDWLLAQQYRVEHPYTHAAPGGWAWTDLPGGVPDADDTAGALLALRNLSVGWPGQLLSDEVDQKTREAVTAGVDWLLNLQNSDGGIPTFCRGWTNLPFDRSGPDLTAHSIRAWSAWLPTLPANRQRRVNRAIERAVRYLARNQAREGCWIPLWFGNEHEPDGVNPVYGTAKVLNALQCLSASRLNLVKRMASNGAVWLMGAQRNDGSWGGGISGRGSVEESALALSALAGWLSPDQLPRVRCAAREAVFRGANWLMEQVENGDWRKPSPIGFYFAKLWYYERLYPLIFTVQALERVVQFDQSQKDQQKTHLS